MQALSFAIHIPLVCFGIAFPMMVLFVERLYLRTGDPLYLTLARRWPKVMLALFAAGVVTGTILSFEMGLLWARFMARFGDVFGLGFTLATLPGLESVRAEDRPPVNVVRVGLSAHGRDRTCAHGTQSLAPDRVVAPAAATVRAVVLPRGRGRRTPCRSWH
jgi:hypothetical protein